MFPGLVLAGPISGTPPPAALVSLLSHQPLSRESWPSDGNLGMHWVCCGGGSHSLRVPEEAGSADGEPSIPESVVRELAV